MKVVCDNCRAVYKIPDSKLVKPVNKATCRNCGHRMLIPRPSPNQDPEERTLVTAVPPTPIGAPPRGIFDNDQVTQAIDDQDEKTLPGGPGGYENAGFPGTPLPTGSRDSRPVSLPGKATPDDSFLESSEEDTRITQRPDGAAPGSGTPLPVKSHAAAPVQARAPVHDPSGDLMVALLAMVANLFGLIILAMLGFGPVVDQAKEVLLFLGLATSSFGGFVALLILMTSQRGRRPAAVFMSVLFGAIFALVGSSIVTVGEWLLTDIIDPSISGTPNMADVRKLPEPVVAPKPAPGERPAPAPDVAPAPAPSASPSPRPSPRPTPTPAPSASPAPSPRPSPGTTATVAPAPAPVASPSPRPAPRPDPAPAPVTPPPAPKAEMSTVPYEVIDVMLRNNMDVKKCFYAHYQKTKVLPPRVDVEFTLLTSGKAENVFLQSLDLAGTDLESCLGLAIKAIDFPPSGKSKKLTYPFVLQG
jgi:predicted Zn finger-like uncharacterized protein